jgi:hypothetical protein
VTPHQRPGERPIFVVGVPRSGTSLVSALLSAHPRIAIAPETHYLNRMVPMFGRGIETGRDPSEDRVLRFWQDVRATSRFSYLGVDADAVWSSARARGPGILRNLFAALLQAYSAAAGKPRWGEKTPGHDAFVPRLLEWFPDARVLYLLRDPRAVIHSLLGTPWGSRLPEDLHALRWAERIRMMEAWASDPRVRVVRYETLVTDPQGELHASCAHVGEEFDAAMLSARSVGSSPVERFGGWSRANLEAALAPVTADRMDRWRAELPRTTLRAIEHYAGPEMERHGYARLTDGLGPSGRVTRSVARTVHRVLRRFRRRNTSWWQGIPAEPYPER